MTYHRSQSRYLVREKEITLIDVPTNTPCMRKKKFLRNLSCISQKHNGYCSSKNNGFSLLKRKTELNLREGFLEKTY